MKSLRIVVRDELSGANEQYVHCGFNEHFIRPHQRNFSRMRVLAATSSTRPLHFDAVHNPQNLFNRDCSIFLNSNRVLFLAVEWGWSFSWTVQQPGFQWSSAAARQGCVLEGSPIAPEIRWLGCSSMICSVPVDATLDHNVC